MELRPTCWLSVPEASALCRLSASRCVCPATGERAADPQVPPWGLGSEGHPLDPQAGSRAALAAKRPRRGGPPDRVLGHQAVRSPLPRARGRLRLPELEDLRSGGLAGRPGASLRRRRLLSSPASLQPPWSPGPGVGGVSSLSPHQARVLPRGLLAPRPFGRCHHARQPPGPLHRPS